jgi:hypothetical protein
MKTTVIGCSTLDSVYPTLRTLSRAIAGSHRDLQAQGYLHSLFDAPSPSFTFGTMSEEEMRHIEAKVSEVVLNDYLVGCDVDEGTLPLLGVVCV